jgi:hypothetical protein
MTLAITHREGDKVVVDAVRERRPPFSPDDVVIEFAATLKSYGVGTVQGDRYGGEWPRGRDSRPTASATNPARSRRATCTSTCSRR